MSMIPGYKFIARSRNYIVFRMHELLYTRGLCHSCFCVPYQHIHVCVCARARRVCEIYFMKIKELSLVIFLF